MLKETKIYFLNIGFHNILEDRVYRSHSVVHNSLYYTIGNNLFINKNIAEAMISHTELMGYPLPSMVPNLNLDYTKEHLHADTSHTIFILYFDIRIIPVFEVSFLYYFEI